MYGRRGPYSSALAIARQINLPPFTFMWGLQLAYWSGHRLFVPFPYILAPLDNHNTTHRKCLCAGVAAPQVSVTSPVLACASSQHCLSLDLRQDIPTAISVTSDYRNLPGICIRLVGPSSGAIGRESVKPPALVMKTSL